MFNLRIPDVKIGALPFNLVPKGFVEYPGNRTPQCSQSRINTAAVGRVQSDIPCRTGHSGKTRLLTHSSARLQNHETYVHMDIVLQLEICYTIAFLATHNDHPRHSCALQDVQSTKHPIPQHTNPARNTINQLYHMLIIAWRTLYAELIITAIPKTNVVVAIQKRSAKSLPET